MTKTENYQLNQWDPEDRVTHTDFNADNAKLDVVLKAQADAVAADTQAWKDAVAAETQARQNAIAAEAQARQAADTAEAKARQEAITAEAQARQTLATQITKCGNCKILMGQYTGTGNYGSGSPSTLTFPQKPLLILIHPVNSSGLSRLALVQGCTYAFGIMTSTGGTCNVTWNGNSVSWYSNSPAAQFSVAAPYIYVTFLAMDE